jgi:hypothetical protein
MLHVSLLFSRAVGHFSLTTFSTYTTLAHSLPGLGCGLYVRPGNVCAISELSINYSINRHFIHCLTDCLQTCIIGWVVNLLSGEVRFSCTVFDFLYPFAEFLCADALIYFVGVSFNFVDVSYNYQEASTTFLDAPPNFMDTSFNFMEAPINFVDVSFNFVEAPI